MNYIVLDLEWNQGNEEKEKQRKDIPFEIIEIGAIKLDSRMEPAGSFHEMVKPQVYREMHRMTRQLLHMDMKQLQGGELFPDVMKRFLSWCGEAAEGSLPENGTCPEETAAAEKGSPQNRAAENGARGEQGGAEQSAAGSACAVPVRHLGAAGSDGAAAEHAFLRHGACGERAGKIL